MVDPNLIGVGVVRAAGDDGKIGDGASDDPLVHAREIAVDRHQAQRFSILLATPAMAAPASSRGSDAMSAPP